MFCLFTQNRFLYKLLNTSYNLNKRGNISVELHYRIQYNENGYKEMPYRAIIPDTTN